MKFHKRSSISYTATLLTAAALLAAGGCGDKKGEAAHETAAQLDSARNAGREAARKIIVREWKDSMQFQEAVLSARAEKSKFEMAGRKESTAAFDSAFISTIRATRPDLAKQLQ